MSYSVQKRDALGKAEGWAAVHGYKRLVTEFAVALPPSVVGSPAFALPVPAAVPTIWDAPETTMVPRRTVGEDWPPRHAAHALIVDVSGRLAGPPRLAVTLFFWEDMPMQIRRWAAITFAVVTAVVMAFQIALALGAPWGAYAMGGAFPGTYPPPMRVAAVVQAGILGLLACLVLARAGVALPRWARVARWAIWVIVALLGVGVVLNLITPSAGERMLWAPVTALMFVCSLLVATGRPAVGEH